MIPGWAASHPPARKCIYDQTAVKYLVQTRDDVEAGDERIKELESAMQEVGLFDTDFSLGDLMVDDGDEDPNNSPAANPKKKKLGEFPEVEGEESLPEYIGQYKRACLNRKALLKSTKERLDKDNAVDYKLLGCNPFDVWSNSIMLCPFHMTLHVDETQGRITIFWWTLEVTLLFSGQSHQTHCKRLL